VSNARVPAEVLSRLLVPNGARTLLTTAVLFAIVLGLAAFAARLPLVIAVPVWLVAGFFANDVFGHVFGLLFFVPFRAARHAHLAHHRHNRTERDPDAYNVGAVGARVKIQFYVVVAFGLLLAPLHFGLLYPAVFMRGRALALHVVEVVVSALGARPRVVTRLDEIAVGRAPSDAVLDAVAAAAHKQCTPLSNVPYDVDWRRAMVPVFVKRALRDALGSGS
jgi:hypothetical protein